MLERIQSVFRNRKAEGDKGFSLVELAVVIVILGILVAIAIPVFMGLQSTAETRAAEADAANGASMVAVEIAKTSGGKVEVSALQTVVNDGLGTGKVLVTTNGTATTGDADLETYCVASVDKPTIKKGSNCS